MNKLGRTVRTATAWLVIFSATVVALVAVGVIVPRGPSLGPSDQPDSRNIYLLSTEIHSDIAVPADELLFEKFGHLASAGFDLDYPGAQWIVFGWGSRAFYINTPTWSDLKPGPLFTALTLDTETVMHVSRVSTFNAASPRVLKISLSANQYDRLLMSIAQSFLLDGEPARVRMIEGVNYTEHDAFFPAKGWFNALVGCNVWTAQILREAGLRTGSWTPLPATLYWSLKLHNDLN